MDENDTSPVSKAGSDNVEISSEKQGEDNLIQLFGRILNTTGEGIANALVEILETGQRTYTDTEGKYSLLDIPVGRYTIRIIATGFRAIKQELVVLGQQEEYQFTLFSLSDTVSKNR